MKIEKWKLASMVKQIRNFSEDLLSPEILKKA